jgi:hypothetical protein
MTFPSGAEPGYRRTPLTTEEKARGEANFAPSSPRCSSPADGSG